MNILELDHAGPLISCQLTLDIGHIDLFGLLRNCSLIWTQKVLQAMEIAFPCQPLLLVEWLYNSICSRAWRLNFNVYGVSMHDTTPKSSNMIKCAFGRSRMVT